MAAKTPVIKYETGEVYKSKSEAARSIGVSISSKVINNPNKTAGGFHFCTSSDVFEGKILSYGHEKPIFNYETKELFRSVEIAEKAINCNIPSYVINNPNAVANGSHWCESLDYFDGMELKYNTLPRSINGVFCYQTGEWFETVQSASKWVGSLSISNLYLAIDNPEISFFGYHWCTDLSVFDGIELTRKVGRVIYCYELKTKFLSIISAEGFVGVSISSDVINNPNKTAAGYHWCDTENYFDNMELEYTAFNIPVYCYQTKEYFISMAEAERSLGVGDIDKCLDNPNRTAGGFHWCTDLSIFDGVDLKFGNEINCTEIFCFQTKKKFKSLTLAAKFIGLKILPSYVINNPNATAGSYHWCTDLSVFEGVSLQVNILTPLLNYETGVYFESKRDAAVSVNMSQIPTHVIDNPNLTVAGYHWCTDLSIFDGKELIYPNTGISSKEKEVLDFVKSLTNNVEENSRKIISPLELDIYIPDHNLAVEFNGNYWHSEAGGKDRTYHINKTNMCKDRGIQLLHIFEHQWLEKSEIFKSVIANKLGFSDKIYARKCKVVELKDCKEFLETNHLQGNCPSSIKLGLTYNDELVSVMTFGKPRFNKSYEYELIRFCNKLNTSVVGGASKLLKYFETKYKPKSLVSYANLQWSDGGLYNQLGFTQKEISTPNYWWIKNGSYALTRYQCQKHKLAELLGDKFNPELSEKDNMENNGYSRLFDCGNMVLEKYFQ